MTKCYPEMAKNVFNAIFSWEYVKKEDMGLNGDVEWNVLFCKWCFMVDDKLLNLVKKKKIVPSWQFAMCPQIHNLHLSYFVHFFNGATS